MNDSAKRDSLNAEKVVRILGPALLLGFVAIALPFAILIKNGPAPDPPQMGYSSSIRIYLWAAWFSAAFFQDRYVIEGSITQLHVLPFVFMAIICCVVQFAVSIRRIPAKDGLVIQSILSIIWVLICQVTYGFLNQSTLIQTPLLPLVSIIIMLYIYNNQ